MLLFRIDAVNLDALNRAKRRQIKPLLDAAGRTSFACKEERPFSIV
jgi:hypothetical protein